MSSGIEEKCNGPHVVIVGAGLGGISTAIALKKQLGFDNFTIFEKSSRVGGTWRDNTYPSCGSDIPAHWYSLSTELNPNWSSYYVEQPEIQAYWEGLFDKYDLKAHTRFSTAVHSAEWDIQKQHYRVTLEDSNTGERTEIEANIVFYAIGGFMSPVVPKDVSSEAFKGVSWHSGYWRHDVDLKGKRVGVIGNGCSAAQFIPKISADPSVEVINFCRTPQWYVPRGNTTYPAWAKWVFAHIPFVMRWYRNWLYVKADISFVFFRKNNKRLLSFARKEFTKYIKHKAPKDQHDRLVPNYPPGCKRIIVDPGYLSSLKRPNVNIRWDAIDRVVEGGIRLKTGEEVPLDIIIFGTGYSVEPVDLRVRGSKGTTIHEYFASHGGATAYLGCCMPGFPNLFTILGPNIAVGHASIVFSEEAQIQLGLQLIKPILDCQARSVEIKEDATAEYNSWLERRIGTSVGNECHSYYQVDGKLGGKNIATFPGPVGLFWWLSRTPRWEHWDVIDGEAWKRQRKLEQAKTRGFFGAFVAAAVGWGLFVGNDWLRTTSN